MHPLKQNNSSYDLVGSGQLDRQQMINDNIGMQVSRMLCLVIITFLPCGVIGAKELSGPNPTDGTFLLEQRFVFGTEALYEFTSDLKETMSVAGGEDVTHEMKLAGTTRQVIAEVEDSGDRAMVGCVGKGRLEITAGSGGTNDIKKDQIWISACRVGRNGQSIRREIKVMTPRQGRLREAIDQISECSQICASFPTGKVTVGSQWTGDVLLPLPGTRQAGKAISTITGVKQTNGTVYCIIKSDVSSEKAQSLDAWDLPLSKPGIEIKGRTEGCFDIRRGIWLQTRIDLDAKFEGRSEENGYEGSMEIKGATKILTFKLLPRNDAVEWSRKVKGFDDIIGQLYGNDYQTPIKLLEGGIRDEKDADWRNGMEVTLSLIRPLMCLEDATRSVKHLESAEGEETSSKTHSNSNVVESTAITPGNVNGDVTLALTMYKQAGEYAQAGAFDKALTSYEAFLAVTNNGIPVAIRLLAQYRSAELYEKTGRTQKALEVYRAMDAIEAADDYSRRLKVKARENIQQLSAGK
jgi:hypothetical protein